MPSLKEKLKERAMKIKEGFRNTEDEPTSSLLNDIPIVFIGDHSFTNQQIINIFAPQGRNEETLLLFKKVFQNKYPITRHHGIPRVPVLIDDKNLLIDGLNNYFNILRDEIISLKKKKGDSVVLREKINHLQKINILIEHFKNDKETFPYQNFEEYLSNKEYINSIGDIDEGLNIIKGKRNEEERVRNLLRQFIKIYLQNKTKRDFDVHDPGVFPEQFQQFKANYEGNIPQVLIYLMEILEGEKILSPSKSDYDFSKIYAKLEELRIKFIAAEEAKAEEAEVAAAASSGFPSSTILPEGGSSIPVVKKLDFPVEQTLEEVVDYMIEAYKTLKLGYDDSTIRYTRLISELEGSSEEIERLRTLIRRLEQQIIDKDNELNRLKAEHRAAIERLNSEHREAIDKLLLENRGQPQQPEPPEIDELLGPETDTHAAELLRLNAEHSAAIDELNRRHSAAIEELNTRHNAAIDELNRQHGLAIEALRENHAAELARQIRDCEEARQKLIQAHALELDALRSASGLDKDGEIRVLNEAHDRAIKLLNERIATLESNNRILNTQMDELRRAYEERFNTLTRECDDEKARLRAALAACNGDKQRLQNELRERINSIPPQVLPQAPDPRIPTVDPLPRFPRTSYEPTPQGPTPQGPIPRPQEPTPPQEPRFYILNSDIGKSNSSTKNYRDFIIRLKSRYEEAKKGNVNAIVDVIGMFIKNLSNLRFLDEIKFNNTFNKLITVLINLYKIHERSSNPDFNTFIDFFDEYTRALKDALKSARGPFGERDYYDKVTNYIKELYTLLDNPTKQIFGGSNEEKLLEYSRKVANNRLQNFLSKEPLPFFTLIEEFETASNLKVVEHGNENFIFESFLNYMFETYFSSEEGKQFYFEAYEILNKKEYLDIANLCFILLENINAIHSSKRDIDTVRMKDTEYNTIFDSFEQTVKSANYDFFSEASKILPSKISIKFFKDHIYYYKNTNSFEKTYAINNNLEIDKEHYDFNEELYFINDSSIYLFFIITSYLYMKPNVKIGLEDSINKFSRRLKRTKNKKTKSIEMLLKERKEFNEEELDGEESR